MSQLPAPSLIADLEVRQDEALQSLAELEQRIELALAEFGGVTPAGAKSVKGRKPLGEGSKGEEIKLHEPEATPADDTQPAAA